MRAIAITGDLGNRIAWLKANYTKRLHMTELAEVRTGTDRTEVRFAVAGRSTQRSGGGKNRMP